MKLVESLRPLSLQMFVDMLARNEHFSFARYGDGEWLAILGRHEIPNANGCAYTEGLVQALRTVIKNRNPYYRAILRIAYRNFGDEIKDYLLKEDAVMSWYRGDVILDQSLKGNLFPLIQQLRKKRVLYVGPAHCQRLGENLFQCRAFVQPPPHDAFDKRQEIVRQVLHYVHKHNIEVIGWSSGLATKVFIDDVWMMLGNEVTQIDFGSMWDGYFGVKSRSYIKNGRVLFEDLLAVNSGLRPKRPGETFRR